MEKTKPVFKIDSSAFDKSSETEFPRPSTSKSTQENRVEGINQALGQKTIVEDNEILPSKTGGSFSDSLKVLLKDARDKLDRQYSEIQNLRAELSAKTQQLENLKSEISDLKSQVQSYNGQWNQSDY